MLKRVEQRNGAGYPRTVSVDPELIVRGTTRAPDARRRGNSVQPRANSQDRAIPD